MASAHVTTRSLLSSFLPRLSASTISNASRYATLYSRQLSLPIFPSLGFALPSATQLNIPGLIEGLWESILRAVPKKKTSHMKTRSRQYAGKGLKDVTSLNKCSACGNIKRAHFLCPYCVNELKNMFNTEGYQEGIKRQTKRGLRSEALTMYQEKKALSTTKPVDSKADDV